MKFLYLFVFISCFAFTALRAQVVMDYRMPAANPDRNGLIGNSITDLVWHGSSLYVGTGYGLSITDDGGDSWQNLTTKDYSGKGGISAMTFGPDGTLWIATGFDTTVQDDQSLSAGGGLHYLVPGSDEWVYIPQPKDAKSDTANGMNPTTTVVQNITYDIAVLDTQVWIASFGGGIRRSLDKGETWQVITTDGKPFGALQYLNHRGFSVLAENGNIWVGTADGISKSADGGKTWQRFTVRDQEPEPNGISGNWIISMAHNSWDNSVWAVTLTTGGNEFNSVSRTLDGGATWQNFLVDELSDGTFARYIAFYDSVTYVATEKGVYKSADGGDSWLKFPTIKDRISGEELLTDKFYSVAASPAPASFHTVWLGSADGLSESADNGYDWTVFRSFVSTRQRTDPPVYAYPNPFSPARGDYVRFQYDITRSGMVEVDIYNFAMEKVTSIKEYEEYTGGGAPDRSAKWDGRDNNGRMVDNGVYFFRAKVEGNVNWGKIVVLN
ncbi:MAG: hypothetical protein P8184_07555 [Calditrichia bacterium]